MSDNIDPRLEADILELNGPLIDYDAGEEIIPPDLISNINVQHPTDPELLTHIGYYMGEWHEIVHVFNLANPPEVVSWYALPPVLPPPIEFPVHRVIITEEVVQPGYIEPNQFDRVSEVEPPDKELFCIPSHNEVEEDERSRSPLIIEDITHEDVMQDLAQALENMSLSHPSYQTEDEKESL